MCWVWPQAGAGGSQEFDWLVEVTEKAKELRERRETVASCGHKLPHLPVKSWPKKKIPHVSHKSQDLGHRLVVCLGGVWPAFRVSLRVGRVVRVWGFCDRRQRPHPGRLSVLSTAAVGVGARTAGTRVKKPVP